MLERWFKNPISILKTRENVVLIQLHPKHRAISVSYKGNIRKGKFEANTLRNLLHNGKDFDADMTEVLTAIGQLLQQLIEQPNAKR